MSLVRRFSVGDATIEVNDWGTCLSWPDGTFVNGCPQDTSSYRDTAERLGYGQDTLTLCIDHEVLHVLLESWLGQPSVVMFALRGGQENTFLAGLEEDAILALQRYLRARNIDVFSLPERA